MSVRKWISSLNPIKLAERFQAQQQIKYLPDSVLLEEYKTSSLVLLGIAVTSSIVIALIIWAALVRIDETSIAMGEVVPQKKIVIAQHLEGGIIREVLVNNGDLVSAGDVLIDLDKTDAMSELGQMQAKETKLKLDISRIEAYLNEELGGKYSDSTVQNQFLNMKALTEEEVNEIQNDEVALMESQKKSRELKKKMLYTELAKANEKIITAKAQEKNSNEQLALLKRELKISDSLLSEQLISEKEYLSLLKEINNAQRTLTKAISDASEAMEEKLEVELKLKELDAGIKEEASKNLLSLRAELLQTQKSISKIADRVERLAIISPVDGIVQGINLAPGTVVGSGENLMEIVPQQGSFIVETKIHPKDIGHIHIGDLVKVKVSAYDYSRYGAIEGVLSNISASTFKENGEGSYYKGEIKLAKQYLGNEQYHYNLLPGMRVQADIITGDKTLLQYMLKPIQVALSSSFVER